MQDGEIRKAFQRALTKQGFKFKLGVKVNSAKVDGKSVVLDTESVKDGKKEEMKADIVLVSAGKPLLQADLICLCMYDSHCIKAAKIQLGLFLPAQRLV